MISFCGETANEVWVKAAQELLYREDNTSSRIGFNREILHAAFSITDPRQRWVTSRLPSINPAFALAELVWIVNGAREAKTINFWNPILPRYAGNCDNYHGAYGYRIKHNLSIDQFTRAYQALKSNPESRQVVIQIWDSRIDFPDVSGQPVDSDIPCNICSMIKVRNGKLEWTQILRSNDIFLGVPHNFVQFTGLQEILAGWLDIEVGSYVQYSDSLHLYEKDIDVLAFSSAETKKNMDSLAAPKDQSEKLFNAIYRNMKKLMEPDIKKTEFMKALDLKCKNRAYQNIMFIIGADAARRKGWAKECINIISICDNPVYRQLWDGWIARQIAI